MKIRTDFVTNSSSSSFILARKSGLNEKQKQEILQFVEKEVMGDVILTPESSEEEIKEVFEDWPFSEKQVQKEVRQALESGMSIHQGVVSFEDDMSEYAYSNILTSVWKIMEKNSDGNFKTIDDDLDY